MPAAFLILGVPPISGLPAIGIEVGAERYALRAENGRG
jgi:hypothetical protein